jgi:hypothetical protein
MPDKIRGLPQKLSIITKNELATIVKGLNVIAPAFIIGVAVWGICTNQNGIQIISLIVSITVAYIVPIRSFLEKPRLELCLDRPRCSSPHSEDDTESWFIRLKIRNYGLTSAKNCVGRVFEVWRHQGEQKGQQIEKFDPLTLFWARQDNEHTGFTPANIQGRGDYEYLDIAQIKKWNSTPLKLRVVIPHPMTLTKWPSHSPSPGTEPVLKAGTYYLKIGVYAENASLKPTWFKVSCSETVPPCGKDPPYQIEKEKPSFAM